MAAYRTQGLCQDHTGATVKQAVRLVRPGIHGQPTHDMAVGDLQDLQTQGIADGSGTQGAEFLLADALGKGAVLVHHDKFNRWKPRLFRPVHKGIQRKFNAGPIFFSFWRQRLETCPSYTWMQLHGCIGFNILAGFGGGRNAPFILFDPMPHEAGVWCRKTDRGEAFPDPKRRWSPARAPTPLSGRPPLDTTPRFAVRGGARCS